MKNLNNKLDRTLVVRISSEQYTRLLEVIVNERKKGYKSDISNIDKSKFIREMLMTYTSIKS